MPYVLQCFPMAEPQDGCDLPQIPCDPKMLVNPLQPEQLAEFKLTRMELESRHEMPVPMDLGIPISALDIQKYAVPDEPEPLDPADELLLQVHMCPPPPPPPPPRRAQEQQMQCCSTS